MKTHARVVVVGGGIMGVSVLYHLALEGWTDVVLLEKGELTSGTTWHAAGHCPTFSTSLSLTAIQMYGNALYPKLEALTGVPVSWHGCGGVRLATTDNEVDWFTFVHGTSKIAGYEAHLIPPEEIRKYHPYVDTFGVKLGFLTVTDGHVAPADVTNAMAAGARQLGAAIHRNCRATDIKRLPSGEWKVFTEQGDIVCDHVVNAAGSYANVVAAWTGHRVPIVNMLHHYIVTERVDEIAALDDELPIIRDPYACCYIREETNGILVGPYEQQGAHTCWNGGAPDWDFESELLPPELDRLTPWLERAAERMPLFATAGIKAVVSGAITHTPDANFLLGPAAGPRGYWMANGAAIGICQAAGGGKYLAQWMVHGAADIAMREFDPRRFGDWASDTFTADTAIEDYENMFRCYPPAEQHVAGRPLRTSTIHDRLEKAGAQFQQVMGWERPRWFDPSKAGEKFSFRRSNWWRAVEEECLAVRERVGLADLSSFSKFEVTGRDSGALLDRLSANRIPAKDGRVGLCHFLTESGRIESEATITRFDADRFYVLSAAVAQIQDIEKMRHNVRPGEQVSIEDVTDRFGCLLLTGPEARNVLSRCTDLALDNGSFPWLSARIGTVAGIADVRLLRVTYTGELGWELHCPMADMPAVFDRLMEAGRPSGIRPFGAYAMNSLRMEKAYRAWGVDITNEIDMIEGSMERFLRLDRDFVGRAATLVRQQAGPRIKLVYMDVDATDTDCRGGEPILLGDAVVGSTTGGAYGFAVGKSLTFGYVKPTLAGSTETFDIVILGQRRKARMIAEPAYDPANDRLKA